MLGPWKEKETELFVNVGRGFHSNDARGATITVDPTDGVTPVERVDPLVEATGVDVGVRTTVIPTAQPLAMAARSRHQLLFVGDAGTTEPSRKSERRGIELAPMEDIHFHPVEPRCVRLTLSASF